MKNTSYPRIITDENLMETQPHGQEEFPFRFYDERMAMFDFHCIDWHWHQELEFMYVESGEIEINTNEESFALRAGEAVFINSKILHRFHSVHDAAIPNFVFSPVLLAPEKSLIYRKYVQPFLASSLSYFVFRDEAGWQREVLCYIRKIIDQQRTIAPDELATVLPLFELWALLYENITLSPVSFTDPHTVSSRARAVIMMQYIQQNYMHTVSLDEIASAANISKSTALSLFRKNLKTTPYDYLISFRLGKAAVSLRTSEQKISRISYETGFENVDYFCRAFKKRYHMTPTEYRESVGKG